MNGNCRERDPPETEKAFSDFEEYVKFIKAQPGARFVTATELMKLYADRSLAHNFNREEILALAKAMRNEITFQKFDAFTLSAADVFTLLNEAMNGWLEKDEMPAAVKTGNLGWSDAHIQPARRKCKTGHFQMGCLRRSRARNHCLLPRSQSNARGNLVRR